MIDAIDGSLQMLATRPGPRRPILLLISESKDRGSEGKLPDLVSKIQRTGVTIYSLTYSAYLTPFTTRPKDYSAPVMAESTDVRNEVSVPPYVHGTGSTGEEEYCGSTYKRDRRNTDEI